MAADKHDNMNQKKPTMMNRTFVMGLLLSLLGVNGTLSAQPLVYGGNIESTEWRISGSVFECRFEQTIPRYGRALFYHQAGEDAAFQLWAQRNMMAYSAAQVSILPPPWQPSLRSERLGTVNVVDDAPLLVLDSQRTQQFIHGLLEGKWPTIAHHTHYDRQRYVKVHLSAVQFDEPYRDYLACVDQLLPMNFNQVARSRVLFGLGKEAPDDDDMALLDRIIFYVQNDPRVFAIYLDGHSDNIGRRYDNRQLSKARAEEVERYFIRRGIDPDMITTRFHGSRYPIASNDTAQGRAENRRVTIRLEQRDDMAIPDNLRFQLPVRPRLNTAAE